MLLLATCFTIWAFSFIKIIMVKKKCLYCWEEFEVNNSSQKFCCYKHWQKYRYIKNKPKWTKRKCLFCWTQFTTNRKEKKFCCRSHKSKYQYQQKNYKKKCKYCKKIFYTKHADVKFCSLSCGSKYNNSVIQQTCLDNNWVRFWFELCKERKACSWWNKQFWEWISAIVDDEVIYEFPLWQYNYDIKVWNFLFEIDPIWTHNSSKSFFENKSPLDKYYHQKKSLTAEKEWYHCIHLFERDNNEVVKDWIIWLLTKRKRLYHWEIKKVNWKDAEIFYSENHLQWKCSATVHYWLYVKGQLINCMSFTCFKWERTLVRFASLRWYRIAHWAEKLFKAFIDEYDPDYIVSFSDITKHSGWLYNALWFKLDRINEPSYWRVNATWTHVYWRRDCQKQNMHNVDWFDHNYKYLEHKDDPFWKQSEKQLMESHWYLKIYDAGMRKHVWTKQKD